VTHSVIYVIIILLTLRVKIKLEAVVWIFIFREANWREYAMISLNEYEHMVQYVES
jgi:hypothetical protein